MPISILVGSILKYLKFFTDARVSKINPSYFSVTIFLPTWSTIIILFQCLHLSILQNFNFEWKFKILHSGDYVKMFYTRSSRRLMRIFIILLKGTVEIISRFDFTNLFFQYCIQLLTSPKIYFSSRKSINLFT